MRKIAVLGLLVAALSPASTFSVPAAQASPASPASGTGGQLTIVSQPGVEVVWEGVSLGTTHDAGVLVIEDIPSGSYSLRFRLTGYQDRTAQVDIESGEKSIRIELQRIQPVAPPPAPTSTPAPAPTPAPALAVPPTLPPAQGNDKVAAPIEAAPIEAAQAQQGRNTLPPVVYILGLALVGALGALAFQQRRHIYFREDFPVAADEDTLESSPDLEIEPPPNMEDDPPAFFSDIRRREVDRKNSLEAGPIRPQPDAIDADFEVIDLGPVESED